MKNITTKIFLSVVITLVSLGLYNTVQTYTSTAFGATTYATTTMRGSATVGGGTTASRDNAFSVQTNRTFTNSGTAQADAGAINFNCTNNTRECLELYTTTAINAVSMFRIENNNTANTAIMAKFKTNSTSFAGNLLLSLQGKVAPAIELNEDVWNGGTLNQGQGLFQMNSHSNAFRIDSRNNTNNAYCSDFIMSGNFASTTNGKLTLFNCTNSSGTSSEGSGRFNLFGTSTVANLVNFTSLQGATQGDLFVVKQAGNVGIGTSSPYTRLGVAGTIVADNYIATSTATSTFAGPIAIKGYPIATTTCVSYIGEDCTYQVSPTSTSSDIQINAAMLAVSRAGGGIVDIKHGTYIISNILQVPSNVYVRGAGIDITTIKADNGYNPSTSVYGTGGRRSVFIDYNSSPISNVRISDLTVDQNVQNIPGLSSDSTHRAFWFSGVNYLVIERVKVTNSINYMIYTGESNNVWFKDNIVLGGFSSTYNQNDGLHIRNSSNVWITNNVCDTNAGTGNSGDDCVVAVVDNNATSDMVNVVFTGNNIYGSGSRGIIGDIDSTFNIRNFTIANNNIASTTLGAGIKLYVADSTTGKYFGTTIGNNTMYRVGINGSDGGDCIRLDRDYGTSNRLVFEDITITGNTCKGQLTSSWYGVNFVGQATDIVIADNNFDDMSGLGGIKLGSSSNSITDFTVTGNKMNISGSASSAKGIWLYNAKRGIVNNNNIYGHTTGTTDCIYLESTSALTTTYNDVSHNNCYTFDNGIREVNSGANPDFNQYIGNIYNNVTTKETLLGTSDAQFTQVAGNFGIGTDNPQQKLDLRGILTVRNTAGTSYADLYQTGFDGALGSSNSWVFQTNNGFETFRAAVNGTVGFGTSTPSILSKVQISSSTAPQLALGAGTGLAQWVMRNAGGNFYMATTTVAGTSTTTPAAFDISGSTGISNFQAAVYTMQGLRNGIAIGVGDDTTINDVNVANTLGINGVQSTAVGGIKLGSGGPTIFGVSSNFGIATITPQYVTTSFSATAPQLSLSAGAGIAQWAFRNAGGNLYFSTTTVAGTATTSTPALTLEGSSGDLRTTGSVFLPNNKALVGKNTSGTEFNIIILNNADDLHLVPNFTGANTYIGFNNSSAMTFGASCCGGSLPASFTWNTAGATTFQDSGVTNMSIDTSGHIFMPNLSTAVGTPGTICYVTGTSELSKNNALTCTVSSKDYKTKMTYLSDGLTFGSTNTTQLDSLATLMQIQPAQFAYKDQPDRLRWGFYAEDLAKVDPKLADGYDKDGHARSIDQNGILAVLVNSVKEIAQAQGIVPIKRSMEENWQWLVMGLLVVWNLYLTFRKRNA
jgi:hypothetical protein